MTEMPPVMTGNPPVTADLLSDLLGGMHLSGTVLFRAAFREPWSVVTPPCSELAGLLTIRTGHMIPFHVIATGRCWLALPGHEPVWLSEGDAVLLPFGEGHRMGGCDAALDVPVGQLLPRPPWTDMPLVEFGGPGALTSIICGFLQCDELLFHPVAKHLPTLLHVSPAGAAEERWLASTIRHTAQEACHPMPGSRSMLPRLTELLFIEILRKHVQELSADEIGWFAASKDPLVGSALKCLHADPFAAWSLESLARHVGSSRTHLSERFKHFLGAPPMQYLARWRLQLAAQKLREGDLPIKTIADESGYESEAAFSRAFKRRFGAPPGEWRHRQI